MLVAVAELLQNRQRVAGVQSAMLVWLVTFDHLPDVMSVNPTYLLFIPCVVSLRCGPLEANRELGSVSGLAAFSND